ncbi:MAG: Lpg1974 family pore-forming outer membrane protein [Pirellulaceae bacterium]
MEVWGRNADPAGPRWRVGDPGTPLATPDYDYDPALRLWAGREDCRGLGARLTYFGFDEDTTNGNILIANLGSALEVYAFDLELTQRAKLSGWDLLFSGGMRIGGIDQSLSLIQGPDALTISRDFDGVGLTIGLGAERAIGGGLGFYSNLRGSLLYGDADIDVTATPGILGGFAGTVAQVPNQTISVMEVQMGLEYERNFGNTGVTLRAGFEGQLWEQPPIVLGLLDSNVGLVGPTVSIAFTR